jgi:hypothetical protein
VVLGTFQLVELLAHPPLVAQSVVSFRFYEVYGRRQGVLEKEESERESVGHSWWIRRVFENSL